MQTIHLQGLGSLPAKPAGELKIGDVLSWNCSYRWSEVVEIAPCGAKSVTIKERSFKDSKIWERRLLKTRLIAAQSPPAAETTGASPS